MKVRLSKPYFGNRKKLLTLIESVLDSGYLTQGKYVAQLEQQVANYLGVKHAIAVSSGTAALHLSLIVLGIGSGDEVIVPAYTFPATANVVELVGAKPVFVDVSLDTYNINVEQIISVVSPKTKAIMPVHLFGNPADMDPIIEMANIHRLAVIEDAAASLGSEYKGIKCGSLGDLGCFSFHPRKIVTTGEGGMVTTNNDGLAEMIRCLRNHGIHTVETQNDFISTGFNYRMNEIEAVIGVSQMSEIGKIAKERQKIAQIYMDFLKDIPDITFQKILPECLNTWQSFVIKIKCRSVHSILKSLKKMGIEATIGTYALHLLKYYKEKYDYQPSDYQNAETLYRTGLALPFFKGIPLESINQVALFLREVLNED